MYPPMPGYDQQMFAYLQAWRQFLDQWAAMMPAPSFPMAPSMWPTMPMAGQFMAPAAPFMPSMPPYMAPTPTAPGPPITAAPPGPPAPADYTQQLFSYLQAWRQYLEQMTGATPGSPQASQPSSGQQPTAKNPPANDSGNGSNPPWPPSQLNIRPDSPGGSQLSDQASELVDIPPMSEYRSEYRHPAVDPTNPFGPTPDTAQLRNPPDYAFGYRDYSSPGTLPAGAVVYTAAPDAGSIPAAAAQLPVATPFSALMERVEPIASPQSAPKSLFSTPGP